MDKQQAIKQALEQVRELAKKYDCTVVLEQSRFSIEHYTPVSVCEFKDFMVIPKSHKSAFYPTNANVVVLERDPLGMRKRVEAWTPKPEIVNVITSPIHKSKKKR